MLPSCSAIFATSPYQPIILLTLYSQWHCTMYDCVERVLAQREKCVGKNSQWEFKNTCCQVFLWCFSSYSCVACCLHNYAPCHLAKVWEVGYIFKAKCTTSYKPENYFQVKTNQSPEFIIYLLKSFWFKVCYFYCLMLNT